jgi:asparagine synthase (glutamine-hydrolysing)
MVRSTGSRILLTGVGPDYYLHGNLAYFTDWITRGRIRDAAREMYLEALRNRGSFWRLAYDYAVKPFFRQHRSNGSDQWPDWVDPSFARRFQPGERQGFGEPRPGTPGRLFVNEAAKIIDASEFAISRGVIGATLDVRCPFLYRPLVELCLQMPPELKITDGKHKWVLRETMRGILPEEVRNRTSKGFINFGIDRAFVTSHARLDALLQRSVLGELGCIDVPLARRALAERTKRVTAVNSRLENLLTLETWLAVKSGRWIASEVPQLVTQ